MRKHFGRPKIFLNTELLVDIGGEDMVSCVPHQDQMRHSDSLPSTDLLQRLWGSGLVGFDEEEDDGGVIIDDDGVVIDDGGVSVGEFPSEQREALGLSTEFIRAPPLRPCLFASKLI